MQTIILVLLVIGFVGGGYGYFGGGPNYPYRGYALPGLGGLLVVILLVYLILGHGSL